MAQEATARSMAGQNPEARLQCAFETCGDELYRFIVLRVSGDTHAADDVIQETCYEAARRGKIPNDENAAKAWLFGIAKNLIRRHFRQLRRDGRRPTKETDGRTDPSSLEKTATESIEASGADMAPHLLTAISSLSDADQQLILGAYFENRSHEELALAAGVSVRAVEGRLYRARAALRQALSGLSVGNES